MSEQTFFQLVQYFAIVLFECNEHEDYGPAKTLMNMCFTYYHEGMVMRGWILICFACSNHLYLGSQMSLKKYVVMRKASFKDCSGFGQLFKCAFYFY